MKKIYHKVISKRKKLTIVHRKRKIPATIRDLFVVRFLLFIFFTSIFTLVILFAAYHVLSNKYKNVFLRNIFIEDLPIGMFDKEYAKKLLDTQAQLVNSKFIVIYNDKTPVATYSASIFSPQLLLDQAIVEAYAYGHSGNILEDGYNMLKQTVSNNTITVHLEKNIDTKPINTIVSYLDSKFTIAPADATFEEKNGKVTKLIEDKLGFGVNTEELTRSLQKIVSSFLENANQTTSYTVTIPMQNLQPTKKLKDVNPYGIEELIGIGASDYTGSIPNRIYNLTLASDRISGSIFAPNANHSFNEHVGDVSSSSGYKSAYVIINGRTQLGDGGGVCQVSTTFFRGLLNTGLPIVERNQHAYRVGYYENDSKLGVDAAIYTPSVDLRFVNDTNNYIVVMKEQDPEHNKLYFKFYGKKDGRKSVITEPIIYNVSKAPAPIYEDDPTLKRGITKQVDFAAGGASAKFTYTVYKDGLEYYKKDFISNYKPWPAVYKVGTAD